MRIAAILLCLALFPLTADASGELSRLGPEWSTKTVKRMPGSLKKQLAKARKLLVAKEYIPLFEMLMHPEDLERMPSLDQVAERFDGRKADALLEAFDAAATSEVVRVTHSETKEKFVVIRVTETVTSVPDDLAFTRFDGTWRLKN